MKGGDLPGRGIGVASVTGASRNGLGDHIPWIVETGIEAHRAPERAGDARNRLVDLTRAADLLGYRPTVALREGRRRAVEGPRGSSGPGMRTPQ